MTTRCGELAVVGRPNVGKSTLINQLVGAKVGITSKKPQTTRGRLRGILTRAVHGDDCQFIFVDTPGFQSRHKNALYRQMNRSVTQSFAAVDVILLVIEAGRWGEGERDMLKILPATATVILVINKIDRVADKAQLLPFIEQVAGARTWAEIVPLCAERGEGTEELLATIARYLPAAPHAYEADAFTDRNERQLAAELLREKLFRNLGEELPYGLAVEIEKFEQEGALRRIHAAVLVDKPAHKAMVIGRGGERLKRISSSARSDMEQLFGGKVWLETWVKVKSGWADDERILRTLGYE